VSKTRVEWTGSTLGGQMATADVHSEVVLPPEEAAREEALLKELREAGLITPLQNAPTSPNQPYALERLIDEQSLREQH
jgi:hypothetical protein